MLTTAERHTAISPTPANWSFLTNHARVLLCIAHDPGMRLRDIAARLGITERSAYGIVTELAQAATSSSRRTAAATATRSRRTSRSPNPPAGNARSARCWPFWPAPTRARDRPEGRTEPPRPGHIPAPGEPDRRPGQHREPCPAGGRRRATVRRPNCEGRAVTPQPLPGAVSGPSGRNIRSSVADGADRSTDVIAIAASAPQQPSAEHAAPDLPASCRPQHRVACRAIAAGGGRLSRGAARRQGSRNHRIPDRILRPAPPQRHRHPGSSQPAPDADPGGYAASAAESGP